MNFNKNGYYGKQRPKTSLRQQLYLSIEATFEPEIFGACFTHVDLWFEAKTLTTQIKFGLGARVHIYNIETINLENIQRLIVLKCNKQSLREV